jgi:hypothetical protein
MPFREQAGLKDPLTSIEFSPEIMPRGEESDTTKIRAWDVSRTKLIGNAL